MIAALLFLLDRFAWLFRLLKVDYNQVRNIVGIKLVMDTRRQTMKFGRQQPENRNSFLLTLLFFAILGGIMSFFFALPLILALTFFHAFLIVMITMTLISDFSTVLLDTSDTTIILPRPVTSKTLLLARITHIILYLTQIWISLTIIPFVVYAYKFSVLSAVLFLAISFLSVLISVFFTFGLYLILMRFASEEKLKTLINYTQIGMGILFMGGYQLLPRLVDFQSLNLNITLKYWSVFVPPLWMAAFQEMVEKNSYDVLHILLSLLAVAVPVFGMYLVSTKLAPYFTRKLSDLGTGSEVKESTTKTTGFWIALSKLVSRSALEQATFLLVSSVTSRDRNYKLRIYPALGSTFIIAVVLLIPDGANFQGGLEQLAQGQKYFFALYLVFLMAQTASFEVSFSEDFRSAWVYYSSPISAPGEILSGTMKSILVKYFLPIYVLLSAGLLFIWGSSILPDVILAFINSLCFGMLTVYIGKKEFPFSQEPNRRNQAGSFARMIVIVFLSGIIGVGHYFISKLPYGTYAMMFLSISFFFVMEKQVRKISWDDFEND